MSALASGAQAQAARFQHLYGADKAPLFIHPGAIEQTSDGGAIATGVPGPAGGFFVVKLAADGVPQWGESLVLPDWIGGIHVNIRQTSDGGYILAGRTRFYPIVLIKLDVGGSPTWAKGYDKQSLIANFDSPQVREMSGGGFAVAGTEVSQPGSLYTGVLLLTDASGTVTGGGKYSGNPANIGFSDLRQNADGGFTIAGWLGFASAPRGLLLALRTSALPQPAAPPPVVWAEDFGNPFASTSFANEAVEQVAGGFVFAASEPVGTLLVATNPGGISTWTKSFQGFLANSIHATRSGLLELLLLGGSAGSVGPLSPAAIVIEGNGVFEKGMTYQQDQPAHGEGSEAAPTADGGALLVAGISSGLVVVKTDAALSSGCLEAPFAPVQSFGAAGDSVTLTPAGGFTAADLKQDLSVTPGFIHAFFCMEEPCLAPPANMTLWLPLDELSGPESLNAAGGNHGVQQGHPTPTSGYVGNSLCFDGQQSYVEVPSYPAIDVTTGDLSIDAWIRRSAGDDGTRVIVDKRNEPVSDTAVFGYSFFLLDGTLWFQLADGKFDNYDSTATVPLDGQWHHVAVTVTRNDPAGGHFYLDGKLAGKSFDPTLHKGSLASAFPLRVGSRSFELSAVFRGCIDEVETFSRALGANEIAALSATGSNGKCKQSCYVPWASPFCFGDSSLLATAKICSSMATPQTFTYAFQRLPVGAGCPATGPTTFIPPPDTSVLGAVVLPGQCASVPVTIGRPLGLAANQLSCYSLFVQTAGGTRATTCRGSVQIPPEDLCWSWNFSGPSVTLFDEASMAPRVQNTGSGERSVEYEIAALTDGLAPTPAISLNGLPPGTPVRGAIDLPPGGFTTLDVRAGFRELQPGRFYTLLAQADLRGDGTLVPLASALLQNVIPATCNPPSIVPPQTSRTVAAGQPLTLSVTAANANPASFQWRRNGVDLADGGTLSGTTASTLTIAPAAFTDAGIYEVVVTNECGVATSPPVAVSIAGATCTPGPATLCLNGGRFAAGVDWRTPQGSHGAGQAVQLTSETGYFSFSDPANIELAIKVLDACSQSGAFWVFAAGLTDVEVAITVTDTRTGFVRHYHNSAGQAFLPIQDTSAFATCLAASRPLASAAGRAYSPPARPAGSAESPTSPASAPASTSLVLGGRFRVEAHWQTGSGTAGDGQTFPLSGNSGTFWFFDSNNLELLVKVLDGCSLNGRYWVFAGGLTDVQVELNVTDTLTGAVQTYTRPRGTAFLPIQDTGAFATCP